MKAYTTRKGNGQIMIYEQLELKICQEQTFGVQDGPAKITVKTEKEKDLAEIVQDYFLQSLTISGVSKKKINPDSFSLKTLKILSIFEEDLISSQYSLNWTRSGTMWNGKSSIAGNTKSLKTGLGCTLSDIIEEQPGEEFFLSPKEVDRLTFKGPKMDGK